MSDEETPGAEIVPLVNPATGEVLLLDAPTNALADYIEEIRDLEGRLADVKSAVNRELLRRMDEEWKEWSVDLEDGRCLSAPSPLPVTTYDAQAIRDGLRELGLAEEVIAKVVSEETVLKVSRAGVTRMLKAGGDTEAVILAARDQKPRTSRYVSIKRG